ncbi:hypothetical protein BLNAU_7475 [Blattamonas nauphoetae]|uniref:Uncharacterized protein n=1 Tax=Blattamonas nauphoetae TaxID=2049346 RepID=A0ABQ9Y1G6_9EUKA|nr:hypothetical protein BLNAU_7475 [Blattamonas nauphoetae]
MNPICKKTDTSSSSTHSDLPSPQLPFPTDCSAFLNWDEELFETVDKQTVVFQSFVATLKFQPALDASLEAKAVKLLEYVDPDRGKTAHAFLSSFGRTIKKSSKNFIQSIVVLVSSPHRAITTATMKTLLSLIDWCHSHDQFALVKAGLVPQLINTLNPQSLSFSEAVDIHARLMDIIRESFLLATPESLEQLGIEDEDEQQAVHKTVLKKVIIPSGQFIRYFCVNRYSIIDGELSYELMELLAHLLRISSYYQPAVDIVLHMPVIIAIPCCLTFFEKDTTIWTFLFYMVIAQWEWNDEGGEVPQMGMIMLRMLRMEGIEDVLEEKLQNDRNEDFGNRLVSYSIRWNNLQGMNIPKQE